MIPTHSIVIPVFNAAQNLRMCLDSVLIAAEALEKKEGGQGMSVEIICVDDGSTDDSGAILDEYSTAPCAALLAARVVVLRQSHRGVSAARNVALDVATGEWVSFVDADDFIRPDYFTAFAEATEKFDVNFLNVEIIHPDGLRIERKMSPVQCSKLTIESAKGLAVVTSGADGINAFGWTWNKIIRRRLIEENKIRFDEDISFFEDELFALDLFRHVRSFQILPHPVYCYRRTAMGLTARGFSEGEAPHLMQGLIRRAARTTFLPLKDLVISQVRRWMRDALQDKKVHVPDLVRVFLAFHRSFPELYADSSKARKFLLKTTFLSEPFRVRVLSLYIDLRRLLH